MPSSSPNLLIVDDDKTIQKLLAIAATDHGWKSIAAYSGTEAIRALDEDIRAVVLDLGLPGIDGLETMRRIHEKTPNVPVIMLTGTNDAEIAVKAIKAGAADYLTKPFEIQRLFDVIRSCTKSLSSPALISPRRRNQKVTLESSSPRMKQFYRQVQKAALLESSILLTGESGCGKTYLARKIHLLSKRAENDFITVNCPALPHDLLEAELFGHEKGAIPGASSARPSRFEQASNGTIFLDEIGDLHIKLQPKLLNVLQHREFFHVGGKKPIKTNARVISASNLHLQDKVRSGKFREDLFYRLNIIELAIPPLRERREDIPSLITHILERIASNRGTHQWKLTDAAYTALIEFDWPGNIRQLENVLERSTAFSDGNTIEAEDIVTLLESSTPAAKRQIFAEPGLTLHEIEREAFIQTYIRTGKNKAKTARELGISERSVYNLMARHGLK